MFEGLKNSAFCLLIMERKPGVSRVISRRIGEQSNRIHWLNGGNRKLVIEHMEGKNLQY